MMVLVAMMLIRLIDPVSIVTGVVSYYVFRDRGLRTAATMAAALGAVAGMAVPFVVNYASPPAGLVAASVIATSLAALAWFAVATWVRPLINRWLDRGQSRLDGEDGRREERG